MDDFMLDSNVISNKSNDAYTSLKKISEQLSIAERKCHQAYSEINFHSMLEAVTYTDFDDISDKIEKYMKKYDQFGGYANNQRTTGYSNNTVSNTIGILSEYSTAVDNIFYHDKQSVLKDLSEAELGNIYVNNDLGLKGEIDLSTMSANRLGDDKSASSINIYDIFKMDEVSEIKQKEYEEYKKLNSGQDDGINNYDDYVTALIRGGDFEYATDREIGLSIALDMIPLLGEFKLGYEILVGEDLVSHVSLSAEERAILVATLGVVKVAKYGVGKVVGKSGKAVEVVGKAGKIHIEEVTPPGSQNTVKVYTDGYAQVNKGKIDTYVRGKIKEPENYLQLKDRIKELKKLKKSNPSEFTKEMKEELKSIDKKVHNYERSKGMGDLLDKAGIADTVENNEMIANTVLDAAKEVTPENTVITSYIKGENKTILIESKWVVDSSKKPYLTTIILKEVK